MQQDNSTIRDLANKNPDLYNYYYKWRNTEESELERDIEDVLYCLGYKLKDNECAGEYNDLKGYLECEIIPLSEHPTETIKEEVADLSTGFTGGKWYLADDRPNGWILSSDIIINDKHPVIVVFDKSKEDTANATRIVTCVNNFDALVSALKEVTKEYEYAMKLLAEAGGFTYSENNVSISAKAILNRIDNPTK